MSDRLQDFTPGQRIPGFPSENANAWNDAARRIDLMRQPKAKTKTASREADVIMVENASTTEFDWGQPVAVTDVSIDPSTYEDAFYATTVAKVDDYLVHTDTFQPVPCGVLQTPMRGEAAVIGNACLSGVTPAKVDIVNTNDRFAIPQADGTLASAPIGPVEIIAPDAPITSGVQDCLVRIGNDVYTHAPFLIELQTESATGVYTWTPADSIAEDYGAVLGFDPEDYSLAYEINATTRISIATDNVVKAWVAIATFDTDNAPATFKIVFSSSYGDHSNPHVMDCVSSPSSLTAHTDTWNVDSPASGDYGVQFLASRGPLWDSTNHIMYSFYRVQTADSRGDLATVSGETRTSISFDPCDTGAS